MRSLSVLLSFTFVSTAVAANPTHPALTWGMPDTGRIIVQDGFVLSYDGRLRSARWVAERLTKESLAKNPSVDRQNDYRRDPRVAVEFHANDDDYVIQSVTVDTWLIRQTTAPHKN